MTRLCLGLLVLYAAVLAVLESLFLPVYVGVVPLPVGAFAAALTNAGLVWLAGRLTPRTGVAALPLVGWVLVVLALATGGPGGDQVPPQDWRLMALFGFGVVPAVVVLGGHLGEAARQRAVSGS
ncbi:hypothetical protein [Rhodococcus sp. X156]|uniref:hypothetical protein n=1 Tax=Rhodococcus sp. X156 TaxID=2499145 RepID=UPI000FD79DB7|nr:hypothetical protein [Rhodococcus sp. X156]